MEFCPKCGCVLVEKEGKSGCPRCSYTSSSKISLQTSEKITAKEKVVFIGDKNEEVHPIMDKECPKCKNDKSYFWMLQTRAGDEAPTRFFKCTKCQHTWREYR